MVLLVPIPIPSLVRVLNLAMRKARLGALNLVPFQQVMRSVELTHAVSIYAPCQKFTLSLASKMTKFSSCSGSTS